MFNRVADFHRAFDHPVATDQVLPEQAVRDLRVRLIQEELTEFRDAFLTNDRIEMADALGDLLYVLAGTAVAYGLAPSQTVESPYELDEPLEGFASNHYEALRYEFGYYLLGEQTGDLYIIAKGIHHMMLEIFFIARQLSVPINAVFAEIHRSNMSKLGEDNLPVRRADGKILKGPLYQPPQIAKVFAQHGIAV